RDPAGRKPRGRRSAGGICLRASTKAPIPRRGSARGLGLAHGGQRGAQGAKKAHALSDRDARVASADGRANTGRRVDRSAARAPAPGAFPSLLRRPGLRVDRKRAADLDRNGWRDAQRRTRLASKPAAGGMTMNEFSSHVFDRLDAYTPEVAGSPDWGDVVARARKARTRGLAVVLAATLTLFGSVAAVTAALGGFDRWLSGEPGKPASSAEQQKFEAANS